MVLTDKDLNILILKMLISKNLFFLHTQTQSEQNGRIKSFPKLTF
jgi:hypothetical protein